MRVIETELAARRLTVELARLNPSSASCHDARIEALRVKAIAARETGDEAEVERLVDEAIEVTRVRLGLR